MNVLLHWKCNFAISAAIDVEMWALSQMVDLVYGLSLNSKVETQVDHPWQITLSEKPGFYFLKTVFVKVQNKKYVYVSNPFGYQSVYWIIVILLGKYMVTHRYNKNYLS